MVSKSTSIDIKNLFNKCICENKSSIDIIKARDVFDYTKCPFLIYCNRFVSEDKQDSVDEYQALLALRGNEHESVICKERYPGMVPIKFKTDKEGFQFLLKELRRGTSALRGMPVFYLPENIMGKIDVLEKCNTSPSIFGNYHYIVKEIKLAKNIKKEHIIQAAFYTYIIGKIQGFTPQNFYLINKENEEFQFKFKDYEKELLEIIKNVKDIINKKIKPTPTYGAASYPWDSYTNSEAVETDDISLVNGIGGKKMKAFVEDVNKQMEKMGKNNEIAEKIAEEITNENIDSLMNELKGEDASEEDKIKEAFYRGVWMTLFLIANNHEPGFLEKESEAIRDFHEKMREREEREEEENGNA